LQDVTSIDPDAMVRETEKSSQFRIMSRLTAESEQLLAREGSLYEEMQKNLQLPIIEGAGAQARENAEVLKRQFARGGAARRQGFETVQKIRSQERTNASKMQNISNSRFEMDKWSRDNARTNLAFGQNWAANLGGIRESYQSAMDNAASLMLNSALPIMAQTTGSAINFRKQAHAQNRAKLGQIVSGIVGIAGLAMGGAGATGMLGAAGKEYAGSMTSFGAGMVSAALPRTGT